MAATITYNGVSSPYLMMTLTEVPNILKLSDNGGGTKAEITLEFIGSMVQVTSADSQYYITCMGDTVTNVMNPANNNNKRFYGSQYPESTAMNVVRALRCCGRVAAQFDVFLSNNTTVMIRAKDVGSKWAILTDVLMTNLPNSRVVINAVDGTSSSDTYNAKVNVDIYKSPSADTNSYVTSLEKSYYNGECSFDMSPILETISKYGETSFYSFKIRTIKDNGELVNNGSISGLTTFGYRANQSANYLQIGYPIYLGNTVRANSEAVTLYTYNNVLNYSVLGASNSWIETVSVKNSADVEIYRSGATITRSDANNFIVDRSWTVPETYIQRGNSIDLIVGNNTVRYNVIAPLKAAEYYQRILWRNEYGGISYFDFTGGRSESDSVDTDTYEKNIFDYYISNDFEKKKIYSIDYNKAVSLKSHLLDEGGKYIFNSLMRSKKVWTIINGKTYYIIPKSISIEEDGTYNGIYVAKFTYEYSDL